MAIRTDITVNFNQSPRLIKIAAPSVELSIQDLVDTLRDIEDSLPGAMGYPHLINATGKEDLGGGVLVGITAELQNAQILFESRSTPVSTGTATSGSTATSDTMTLTDTSATFITDGAARGNIVVNHIDLSFSSVLTVDSETQVTVTIPTGGTDNDFDIGEAYDLYQEAQCEISGGNLVAVDSADSIISPVFPTFGTQIIRSSSTSASLVDSGALTKSQFLALK